MSARDRILGRVRHALDGRCAVPHPGEFQGWRPHAPPADSVAWFREMFEAAGGEVVRFPSPDEGAAWLADFAPEFGSTTVGRMVPRKLRPLLPVTAADAAPLGVSMARCAVAETGSLVLDARDGRRTQLLPPTHVVWVHAQDVFRTMREALVAMKADLPSALGLHSGPSKSADIGQIVVRGVHGPGRVVAAIIDATRLEPNGRNPGAKVGS